MRGLVRVLALRRLWGELRLAWLLVRDRRVPWPLKAIPLAAVGYVVWPVDLVPGFLTLLGVVDDLAVAVLGLALFRTLAPRAVVVEHERAEAARRRGGDGGGG